MRSALVKTALFLAILAAGAYFVYSKVEDSEVHSAVIRLNSAARAETGPDATKLRLVASGADSCLTGNDELQNLQVDETRREVVVEVELRIDSRPLCEAREAYVPFVVALERTLSRRVVLDGGGDRREISAPARYARFVEATTATEDEAIRFIREEFPRATTVDCIRSKQVRFACNFYRRGAGRKFVVIEHSQDGTGTWRTKPVAAKREGG